MSSGVNRVFAGSYTGTGAALNVDTVGFKPKFIQFFNPTGLAAAYWVKTMPDAAAFKTFNHATVQHAYVTSNGITPRNNGFTVGTDADLNTDTEVVHFVAHE